MYLDMAQPGATLDTVAAAASMISEYRRNNGLGTVMLDPELTRLADAQSRAMVARDKLDHNVSGTLKRWRLRLRRAHGGGEYLRRLSHAGGGLLGLARFSAAQGQYAQSRRHPDGDRGDLFAEFQIQGVLDAHPCINLKLVRARAPTPHEAVNSA